MFGLSFAELMLLGAIGLIVLGPKQLPEVARMIGRLLNEFKRASGDLTSVLMDAKESTQRSLLDARDEYNKVIENAANFDAKPPEPPPHDIHASTDVSLPDPATVKKDV